MTIVIRRRAPLAALACFIPLAASASPACDRLLQQFGSQLADATCVDSSDLTTTNPDTTPANNSIASLPAFAFTPQTDRATISPTAAKRAPITKVVPGLQLDGRIASDPTGQARFLLRLPKDWNGRLVVAGASGTRSEFNGDFSWSDYVVQKGYAYASQNKGVLNLKLSTAADPLGCRLNPVSATYVNFYDNGPDQPFARWQEYMAGQSTGRGLPAASRCATKGIPPRNKSLFNDCRCIDCLSKYISLHVIHQRSPPAGRLLLRRQLSAGGKRGRRAQGRHCVDHAPGRSPPGRPRPDA